MESIEGSFDSKPSLKEGLGMFYQSRNFSPIVHLIADYDERKSLVLSVLSESISGIDALITNDSDKMREFVRSKSVTIIKNPRETLLAFVKQTIMSIKEQMTKLEISRNYVRTFSKQQYLQEKFDSMVFDKFLYALEDALSVIIGSYYRVHNVLLNEENLHVIDLNICEVHDAFQNLTVTVRSMLNFMGSMSFDKNEYKAQALNMFQVSPISAYEMTDILHQISFTNKPDLNQLRQMLNECLSETVGEYYEGKPESVSDHVIARVELVIDSLASAGEAFDSIPPEQFERISDITSLRQMVLNGRMQEAELKYRERLFMDNGEGLHDFMSEDESFQLWNEVNQILLLKNENEALRRLNKLLADIFTGKDRISFRGNRVSVPQGQVSD